jgi:hypothetical protein
MDALVTAFKKVLEQVILPKAPYISSVEVQYGNYLDTRYVWVDYFTKKRVSWNVDIEKVFHETTSLFRMIGFDRDVRINIEFKMETPDDKGLYNK